MVLLLSEADDPNAKLLPYNGPPVTRVTVDESEVADSDDDSTVHLIPDPPPSYNDVQGFRERTKVEELARLFRAKRRFWLALAIALSLCAIPAISAVIFTRSKTTGETEIPEPTASEPAPSSTLPERPRDPGWGRPGDGPGGHWPGPGGDHGRERPDEGRHPEYPYPPDDEEEEFIECSDWIQRVDTYSDGNEPVFVTNYTLSHTQPITIRSLLERAGGNIRVSVDDKLPADDAYVEITARDISFEGLKDAEICVVHGPRYRRGLHFRAKGSAAEAASYSVHLFISPRKHFYPGIALGLPRFNQTFDDFSYGEFRFVRIGGNDTNVSVISLAAQWMNVWTSKGSIDGTFTAKRMLDISGNSDSVTVTANLCNEEWENPTAARIMSSQGPVDAKVVLCEKTPRQRPPPPGPFFEAPSSRRQGDAGQYEVYVSNSDSPISLQVEHTNPERGSSLWLNVTNIDSAYHGKSHTMVTLDTGFEGNFAVKSSGESSLPVNVTSEEAIDDEGIVRHVEIERVINDGRSISGRVYWDMPSPPSERRRSDVWITAAGQGEISLFLPSD